MAKHKDLDKKSAHLATYQYTHASVSKEGKSAKFAGTLTCANCGWIMHKLKGRNPAICEHCHRDPVTGDERDKNEFFHNELGDDSVKPTTHMQIKWACRSCGHFGIRWVPTKEAHNKLACPECGYEKLIQNVIPSTGRSKSLWGRTKVTRMIPARRSVICQNCGTNTSYKFYAPEKCQECGHIFPSEDRD